MCTRSWCFNPVRGYRGALSYTTCQCNDSISYRIDTFGYWQDGTDRKSENLPHRERGFTSRFFLRAKLHSPVVGAEGARNQPFLGRKFSASAENQGEVSLPDSLCTELLRKFPSQDLRTRKHQNACGSL